MLIVKSQPKLNMRFRLNPIISISINLYKPVNAHTFLTVTETHASNRQTIFFGAPSREPEVNFNTFVEQIERLVLGKNAYVRPSPRPIALPDDWEGKHHRGPDSR